MFRQIKEELTSNVWISAMANLKAEFYEHLTPLAIKYAVECDYGSKSENSDIRTSTYDFSDFSDSVILQCTL